MVIELRGLDHEEWLKNLRLTSLEIRRKKGGLMHIYKITKGFEEVQLGLKYKGGAERVNRRHDSHENCKCPHEE